MVFLVQWFQDTSSPYPGGCLSNLLFWASTLPLPTRLRGGYAEWPQALQVLFVACKVGHANATFGVLLHHASLARYFSGRNDNVLVNLPQENHFILCGHGYFVTCRLLTITLGRVSQSTPSRGGGHHRIGRVVKKIRMERFEILGMSVFAQWWFSLLLAMLTYLGVYVYWVK